MRAYLPGTLHKRNKPVMLYSKTHLLCCRFACCFFGNLTCTNTNNKHFWRKMGLELSSKLIDISDLTVLCLSKISGRTKYETNSLKRTNCSGKSLKIAGPFCWKSNTYLFMISDTAMHCKRGFFTTVE